MGLLPPLTAWSNSEHISSRLHQIILEMSVESYRSASAQLHRLKDANPDDDDATVTCVIVPGGGTATLMIFTVWLPSFCGRQARYWTLSSIASPVMSVLRWSPPWMSLTVPEVHQDTSNSNYVGTSPDVEAEEVSRLWARSVDGTTSDTPLPLQIAMPSQW